MTETYTVVVMDADKDIKETSFDGIVMNAGNFAAEITKMEAIESALTPFLLGKIIGSRRVANFDENEAFPAVPPADHQAQNHTKWILTFKEIATGVTWTRKLGTADYGAATLQDAFSNFYVDLSTGIGATLKTAFDAFITHPDTGGAGALIDMRVFEG